MIEILSTFALSFTLIGLAEMGDKSQLVCMALAARYRHLPVLMGASTAFVILNALAVMFGAIVANWIPDLVISVVVALMFAVFGLHLLLTYSDADRPAEFARGDRHVFVTTLLLILVAEFGDKTQLTVAGLATRLDPFITWLGASLALVLVSALGIWAGRKLVGRISTQWLQRLAGMLFLLFAAMAVMQILSNRI